MKYTFEIYNLNSTVIGMLIYPRSALCIKCEVAGRRGANKARVLRSVAEQNEQNCEPGCMTVESAELLLLLLLMMEPPERFCERPRRRTVFEVRPSHRSTLPQNRSRRATRAAATERAPSRRLERSFCRTDQMARAAAALVNSSPKCSVPSTSPCPTPLRLQTPSSRRPMRTRKGPCTRSERSSPHTDSRHSNSSSSRVDRQINRFECIAARDRKFAIARCDPQSGKRLSSDSGPNRPSHWSNPSRRMGCHLLLKWLSSHQ